jgi:hypothetical protein
LTEPEIRDQMAQALVMLEDFVPDEHIPPDQGMRTAGSVARRKRLMPDCGPGELAYLQWISSQIDRVILAVEALIEIGQEFLSIWAQQHTSSHSLENQKWWNEAIDMILRARQDFGALQPTDLQVWPSYQRERYVHILDCLARIAPMLEGMMATASESARSPGFGKTRELLAFEVVQESLPMLESIQARLHDEVFVRSFTLPPDTLIGPQAVFADAASHAPAEVADDTLNPCFPAAEAGASTIEQLVLPVETNETPQAKKTPRIRKHVFRKNKLGWYSGAITCLFCGAPRLVRGTEREVERLCSYCEYKLSGHGWCDVCLRPLPL